MYQYCHASSVLLHVENLLYIQQWALHLNFRTSYEVDTKQLCSPGIHWAFYFYYFIVWFTDPSLLLFGKLKNQIENLCFHHILICYSDNRL